MTEDMRDANASRDAWERANAVALAGPPPEEEHPDALLQFDDTAYRAFIGTEPWRSDPRYFKRVKLSAVALIKMLMHAKSGGEIEVMGLMLGYVHKETRAMIVTDAFALPVEGTETRVNAAAEGYEYMVEYLTGLRAAGRKENVLGWYHSHPGYGCWLSGIDVATQVLHQTHEEPFLAVVVDPLRTLAAGKVDIGAFRTFPESYLNDKRSATHQHIPADKIEDFGVHAERYYALDIDVFQTSADRKVLDQLWSHYWHDTLSHAPLTSNGGLLTSQIKDMASKMKTIASLSKQQQLFWKQKSVKSEENVRDGGYPGHRRHAAGKRAQSKFLMLMAEANAVDDTSQSETEGRLADRRGSASKKRNASTRSAAKDILLSPFEKALDDAMEQNTALLDDIQHGQLARMIQVLLSRHGQCSH